MLLTILFSCLLCLLFVFSTSAAQGAQAELTVTADWQVQVTTELATVSLTVPPANIVSVTAEKYENLPLFNPNASGWVKGAKLRGVTTQETTAKGYLDPESVVMTMTPGGEALQRDRDYAIDLEWGTFGRLAGGRIDAQQAVYVSYRHGIGRLDSIVRKDKKVLLHIGTPCINVPEPPALATGETALANIWVPGRLQRLSADNIFPILETAYPEPAKAVPTAAERYLSNTLRKLRAGEPVKILAWGDSVTEASYLPHPEAERWQAQFLVRLRLQFPTSKIELVSLGWGGRNTESFLNEPYGSPFNYQTQVLGSKADLIISEFVNDAGLSAEDVETRYSKLLNDFTGIKAEWIILTPHYVRPDWMGLTRERDIDADPRPYVAGLRQFTTRHQVALADASLRWGRLWRQGIPYTTLLLNAINHPDKRGMKLFADSLVELF